MKIPAIPENEEARLKSLYMIDLLDSRASERFDRLTRLGQKLFRLPVVMINLIDRERQWALACEGLSGREMHRDISFCAHAILQAEPLIVNDTLLDERFHDNPIVTGEPHIRFYAGFPVCLPDGAVAGTLCLAGSEPRGLTKEEVASLKDIAAIVEDEFEVISMAMTDSLTEIPNRRGFYRSGEKRFTAFQQQATPFAVLYFDMDKFKPINDMWGHAEGDEVLKIFASHLRALLGPGDIAGRLGGDEFAVMLSNDEHAHGYLRALHENLNEYNQRSGKPYNINYSYGIISSRSGQYSSLNDMLREGDSVMYTEKRRKKLESLR